MSKSAPNPASRILITDSPEIIAKRIKGAVTDSDRSITYDPVARRGVANLLTILAGCEGRDTAVDSAPRTADEVAQALSDEGLTGHAALKSRVTDAVVGRLSGIRSEYERLRTDAGYLSKVAADGAEEAREVAERTMMEVRRKVGLSAI
jgi:tryptophanyl-tRNA synthetase